jgi:hypothetical protein
MLYPYNNWIVNEMASADTPDELKVLYDTLVPVLSKASIGDFDSEIVIDPANSIRVNELLVGVQVLLEVIREKIDELESGNAKLAEAHDRSMSALDEVLRKSLQ